MSHKIKETNATPHNYYICRTPFHLLVSTLHIISTGVEMTSTYCVERDNFHLRRYADRASKIVTPENKILFFLDKTDKISLKKSPAKFLNRKKLVDINEIRSKIKEFDRLFYFRSGTAEIMIRNAARSLEFTLLEDGNAVYKMYKSTHISEILRRLLRISNNSQFFELADKILVQEPQNLPFYTLRNKSQRFAIGDHLESNHFKLAKIFMEEYSTNRISGHEAKKAILVTQPWSEDHIITEAEKIELYKRIKDQYLSEYHLDIKPHPRERTDYTKIFPQATLLPKEVPLEVLQSFLPDYDLYVTISTSASRNFAKAKKKLVLGEDFHLKIHQYYKSRSTANKKCL